MANELIAPAGAGDPVIEELLRRINPAANLSPRAGQAMIAPDAATSQRGSRRVAAPLPGQSPSSPAMLPTGAQPRIDTAMLAPATPAPHASPAAAAARPEAQPIEPSPAAMLAPAANAADPAAADRRQEDALARVAAYQRPPAHGILGHIARGAEDVAGNLLSASTSPGFRALGDRMLHPGLEQLETQADLAGKTADAERQRLRDQQAMLPPAISKPDEPGTVDNSDPQANAAASIGMLAADQAAGKSVYGGPAMLAPAPKTVESSGRAYEFNPQSGHFDRPVGTAKRFTDPFEAFTYGDADERRAARDFISFEKQQGSRFEKPGEIEQRYSLYKRDPDAYKAMFGDRGAAQDSHDQTQATRMLQYFDKQRRAIQNDFTLDDDEKQRQLSEIDELATPYLAIAQPGGATARTSDTNAGGPRPGEVAVIRPDGQPGYIPKKNLAKALSRGYTQPLAQGPQ